jgi:antitoxin component YwqK of YwqJK toxin-antitoxin module
MKNFFFLLLVGLLTSMANAQRQDSKDAELRGIAGEYTLDIESVPPGQTHAYALPRRGPVSEQLNNKPLFNTGVKNGKLHGSWVSWYQNGMPCDSGSLVKGLPDGVWKYWDTAGQLIALRTYSSDKYHRIRNEMTRYHPKKISYPLAALYQQNKTRAMVYMDASHSFGNAVSRETVRRSLPQLVIENITSGKTYKPVFSQALHHGLFMNFSRVGIVSDSGYYTNGLRQGLWIHRDSVNDFTYKGSYNNGIKIKEWKIYTADGKLQELIFYTSKGKIKWRKRFQ